MEFIVNGITLSGSAMLAPMAGFTDRAMRLVCREYGATLSFTEMVSAKAVCFGDKKTVRIARIREDEGPVGLQLFGSEPDTVARAANAMQNGCGEEFVRPTLIDINMGCPVNKIFSNGEGSALMRDPELIYRIVSKTCSQIDVPLSVKLRAGISDDAQNAVECALAAEAAGASFVTVHGRTRVQMYSGKVDFDIIKKVKQALHIPVVANGDITDAESFERLLSYTGCDAAMVGRGAIGNPFLFSEIAAAKRGEPYEPPTLAERVDTAKNQLAAAISDKGERVAVSESRKQIALYFKGFSGSASLRAEINRAESYAEACDAIDRFADKISTLPD